MVAALEEFGFGSLGLTTGDFEEVDTVIQLGYEPNRIDLGDEIRGREGRGVRIATAMRRSSAWCIVGGWVMWL